MNRYNVYSELLDFFNIEIPSNSSFPTNTSLDSTSNNCFRFTIDLTEIWPSMKPEIKAHNFRTGSRVIRSLKSNSWTHVLYEEIHNYTKIPCALNFKSSQVSSSGVFVTVNGQCSECPLRFEGKIFTEPLDNEPFKMECIISDFDCDVRHLKKKVPSRCEKLLVIIC